MKKFKIWFLTKMIRLCNYALDASDIGDDLEDQNWVTSQKNYFIAEKRKLES